MIIKKLSSLLIFALFFTACSSKNKKNLAFDKELSQYEYPFEVQPFKFKSQRQSLVMRYGDLGNKKSLKAIVLLHGKNFSGHYWNRIAGDLVKKGYRVIIPDQIGFGKSSKPETYHYSFQQLAHNTFLLLDSLNIKNFEVVGHSMGGMLATHMTWMNPRVKKLTLINPIGLEDYLSYVQYKDAGFFYKNELNKTVEKARAYQRKNYYDGKWKDAYEELLTPFKGLKNGPDWERVSWNNALTYAPIFENEIISKFPGLRVPVLLILGTRDRTGPGRNWKKEGVKYKLGQYQKLGKAIKKANPRIKLIELYNLGHMPQFEDYNRFSKVFFNNI